MYFKNLIAGCCILSFLFGCAKRNTPASQPIQVKLEGTGECLSNLSQEVSNYSEGKSSPSEVRAFWACMTASIQKFEDITTGDGGDGNYSAASLRQFIEHYFYKTNHIPDNVLAGMMQIKRVLLAGNDQQVSREELIELRALFAELQDITLRLQPQIRILLRKDSGASEAQVRAAAVSLQQAFTQLGAWLNDRNQTLKFQDLTTAVNALAQWMQVGGKDTSAMHTLRQGALVLPEAKSILIGGDTAAISGSDWPYLCNALARGLSLYLSAANGFDANLDAALNRSDLPDMAAATLDVIAQSAQRHANGAISLQEFKNLFAKVAQTDWLPKSISASGLTAVTQWFLTRLLGDGTTPATGLGLAQLGRLHTLTDNWQALIGLPPQDPSPLVQDFAQILASSKPLSWDAQGRMLFPQTMPTSWSADARRHMLWPYVVLRFIKDAYAGPAATSLTEAQMTTAAQEVLPLLQNFGWLKTTQESIGRRILREADLFTLASNGDGVLDLNEATRYLAFIVGSFRSAQVWLDTTAAACPAREAACVRAQGQANAGAVFANMPRLQKVMAGWSTTQFVSYMENAEQTILGAPETTAFTTGDLLETYQLFEYVEVFLELYDADHNEVIDLSEATVAYKTYGPTLGRLLPQSDLGFFTFMMKYGDTPFTMFGGQIAYNYWRWHTDQWTVGADRTLLMGILSQLSKFASQ